MRVVRLLNACWNLFLLMLRTIQPVLVLCMLLLIGWALLSSQPWPFSIEAESEHVSLSLARTTETNWRIDNAHLCVRSNMPELALPAAGDTTACASGRWRAYDVSSLRDVVLTIPVVPAGSVYSAGLDVEPDAQLAMQVRGQGDALPALTVMHADIDTPIAIGQDAILKFPAPVAGTPSQRLLLPFAASGTIGKDVSWRESTLLQRGSVSLYTRSADAAGGRARVETTDLLPGDRVDLGDGAEGTAAAKGFVQYDRKPAGDAIASMRVVAFGASESLRIVRFGDQGYSFAPGVLARLSRHSAVSTWVVLIFSLLGVMAVYREGSDIGESEDQHKKNFRQRARDIWRRAMQPRHET